MSEGRIPAFVCPRCHGALHRETESFQCRACPAEYPVVLGIPDFRIFPDPWISMEDDRAKARRLAQLIEGQSFDDAVRSYWEITPTTPKQWADHFTTHVLQAESRASEWLSALETAERPAPDGCWIDVGCGTGDVVAAGVVRGVTVVGIDIALRWLVVAMRRDALAGRVAQLVCANGEHLPFANGSITRAVSLGTLEHCQAADKVVADIGRVLVRGGVLAVRTVNRYSILPEPHVGVWGVGFVPRRWADRYVQWRSGLRYQHHYPQSPRKLQSGFRRAGFTDIRVDAAALLVADLPRLGEVMRMVAPWYERLRQLPIIRGMLRWIAPLLEARGTAR